MNNDKNINKLLGVFITTIVTLAITLTGAWNTLTARISVLEVEMQEQKQQVSITEKNIADIRDGIADIKQGITHLNDIKENREPWKEKEDVLK